MRPRSIVYAFCLLATLAAVACSNDDAAPGGSAGSSGKGNAGSGGNGKAGNGSTAGAENSAGENAGGSAGMNDGAAGDSGQPMGCTHFSEFVHAVIKGDTNGTSSPRPVNDVVFCDDMAGPAAYDDLF